MRSASLASIGWAWKRRASANVRSMKSRGTPWLTRMKNPTPSSAARSSAAAASSAPGLSARHGPRSSRGMVATSGPARWLMLPMLLDARSGNEIDNPDAGAGRHQRSDGSLALGPMNRLIAPAERGVGVGRRPSVDLHDVLDEVDDPVIRNPGARVQARFLVAVDVEARLAHFDDEDGPRGMTGQVVAKASGHHGDVRFRLRVVIERQRSLDPDVPAGPERRAERFLHGSNGREVVAALGLGDDEVAAHELDGLVRRQDAGVDQTLVLDAPPAPDLHGTARHAVRVAMPPAGRQSPLPVTPHCCRRAARRRGRPGGPRSSAGPRARAPAPRRS